MRTSSPRRWLHLLNLSFAAGVFPSGFKLGHVVLLLKKPGSDKHNPSNYRPITNLVTISEILERLVLARLQPHIHSSLNFGPFQSAYRRSHSTETALLRVVNDLNASMKSGSCSVLISLRRLESNFGVVGTASAWLRSYLIGWACYVVVGQETVSPTSGLAIREFHQSPERSRATPVLRLHLPFVENLG